MVGNPGQNFPPPPPHGPAMAPPGAHGGPNGIPGAPRGPPMGPGQGQARGNNQGYPTDFPTTYEGYTFRKVAVEELPPGEKLGWKHAQTTQMLVSSEELEKRVRNRRLKNKDSVIDEYSRLTSDNQRAQIQRLITEKKLEEENPHAEWTMASIESKILQVGRRAIETIAINVILKRHPKSGLDYQSGEASTNYTTPRRVNLDEPIRVRDNRAGQGPRDINLQMPMPPQAQPPRQPPLQQPAQPPMPRAPHQMPPEFGNQEGPPPPPPPPPFQQPMPQPGPQFNQPPMPRAPQGPPQGPPPGPPRGASFPPPPPPPPPGPLPFHSTMRGPAPGIPDVLPNQGRPMAMHDGMPPPPPPMPGMFQPDLRQQRQHRGSPVAEVILTDNGSDDESWTDLDDPNEIVGIVDEKPKKHRNDRGRSPAVEAVRMKHRKSRSRSVGRRASIHKPEQRHYNKEPRRQRSKTYIREKETIIQSGRDPTKSPRQKVRDWEVHSINSSDDSDYHGRGRGSSQFSDAGGSDFTSPSSYSSASGHHHRRGSLHRSPSDEEHRRHRLRERVHEKPAPMAPSPPRRGRSPHYRREYAGERVDVTPGYGYRPRLEERRTSIRGRTPERPAIVSYDSYPADAYRYAREPQRLEPPRQRDAFPWEFARLEELRRKEAELAEHVRQNEARAAYQRGLQAAEQERRIRELEERERMQEAVRRVERMRLDERLEGRPAYEDVTRVNIRRPASRGGMREYGEPVYSQYGRGY